MSLQRGWFVVSLALAACSSENPVDNPIVPGDTDPAGGGDSNTSTDTTAPVTSASPAGGTHTDSVEVTLACTDDDSGCQTTHFTTDGSVPSVSSPTYSAPFTLTATTTVMFFSVDVAGNAETTKIATFTVQPAGPAAPTVVSTTPAANAVDVGRTTAVAITFSEAMNLTNAASAVDVTPNTPVTVSASGDNRTLYLTPTTGWQRGVSYDVEVSTSLLSAVGVGLAVPFALDFTVVGTPAELPTTLSGGATSHSSVAVGYFESTFGHNWALTAWMAPRRLEDDGRAFVRWSGYSEASSTWTAEMFETPVLDYFSRISIYGLDNGRAAIVVAGNHGVEVVTVTYDGAGGWTSSTERITETAAELHVATGTGSTKLALLWHPMSDSELYLRTFSAGVWQSTEQVADELSPTQPWSMTRPFVAIAPTNVIGVAYTAFPSPSNEAQLFTAVRQTNGTWSTHHRLDSTTDSVAPAEGAALGFVANNQASAGDGFAVFWCEGKPRARTILLSGSLAGSVFNELGGDTCVGTPVVTWDLQIVGGVEFYLHAIAAFPRQTRDTLVFFGQSNDGPASYLTSLGGRSEIEVDSLRFTTVGRRLFVTWREERYDGSRLLYAAHGRRLDEAAANGGVGAFEVERLSTDAGEAEAVAEKYEVVDAVGLSTSEWGQEGRVLLTYRRRDLTWRDPAELVTTTFVYDNSVPTGLWADLDSTDDVVRGTVLKRAGDTLPEYFGTSAAVYAADTPGGMHLAAWSQADTVVARRAGAETELVESSAPSGVLPAAFAASDELVLVVTNEDAGYEPAIVARIYQGDAWLPPFRITAEAMWDRFYGVQALVDGDRAAVVVTVPSSNYLSLYTQDVVVAQFDGADWQQDTWLFGSEVSRLSAAMTDSEVVVVAAYQESEHYVSVGVFDSSGFVGTELLAQDDSSFRDLGVAAHGGEAVIAWTHDDPDVGVHAVSYVTPTFSSVETISTAVPTDDTLRVEASALGLFVTYGAADVDDLDQDSDGDEDVISVARLAAGVWDDVESIGAGYLIATALDATTFAVALERYDVPNEDSTDFGIATFDGSVWRGPTSRALRESWGGASLSVGGGFAQLAIEDSGELFLIAVPAVGGDSVSMSEVAPIEWLSSVSLGADVGAAVVVGVESALGTGAVWRFEGGLWTAAPTPFPGTAVGPLVFEQLAARGADVTVLAQMESTDAAPLTLRLWPRL